MVLLGAARDASRLALPHRLAAAAQAGLEALRDRGGGPGRRDHPHAGAVRDRPAGQAVAPVHDPDVLHRGRRSSVSCSPRAPRRCCRAVPRCMPISPTPACSRRRRAALRRCHSREAARPQLGPGNAARLYLFFATWDQETSGLAGQLDALNGYETLAARTGLPKLTAVDEASVEPSLSTVTQFLRGLPEPLSYPVALDRSGRIADGYEVQGLPWFVLTSPTGRILYYWAVSTAGWPSTSVLARAMRAALAHAPGPPGAETARQELAGSPPPLASLHARRASCSGGVPALSARLRALRGYPVVINAWASWCVPCRSEFGLFASASARYGRQSRVHRRRHRRLGRRRAHVPGPTPGQLPQLPDDHHRPLLAGRDRGPADDDLHQRAGKVDLRPHRSIRRARDARSGHQQPRALTGSRASASDRNLGGTMAIRGPSVRSTVELSAWVDM